MIHIVTPANAHRYADAMEQAWRLRHDIFVAEKGWTELARPDGREIDQFDTPHAVHFLAMEGDAVIGYSRLLPTTRPHLLSDVLPQLCEVERPVGPQIWEWTRQGVRARTARRAVWSTRSRSRCSPASSNGGSPTGSTACCCRCRPST